MLLVVGLMLWLRCLDSLLIVGVMRGGGDLRYAALIDLGAIWLVGIPLVALAAFVFHWPIGLVFVVIFSENLVKNLLGLRRFWSRRWIHYLAGPASA